MKKRYFSKRLTADNRTLSSHHFDSCQLTLLARSHKRFFDSRSSLTAASFSFLKRPLAPPAADSPAAPPGPARPRFAPRPPPPTSSCFSRRRCCSMAGLSAAPPCAAPRSACTRRGGEEKGEKGRGVPALPAPRGGPNPRPMRAGTARRGGPETPPLRWRWVRAVRGWATRSSWEGDALPCPALPTALAVRGCTGTHHTASAGVGAQNCSLS